MEGEEEEGLNYEGGAKECQDVVALSGRKVVPFTCMEALVVFLGDHAKLYRPVIPPSLSTLPCMKAYITTYQLISPSSNNSSISERLNAPSE